MARSVCQFVWHVGGRNGVKFDAMRVTRRKRDPITFGAAVHYLSLDEGMKLDQQQSFVRQGLRLQKS